MSDTSGRNQRLDATVPVRFADSREFLVEYSSNISMGGIFVRTSSPAAFGSMVRLALELPGTGQSVLVSGKVAFVLNPADAAKQGKVPGMGVRFSALEPASLELLSNYVGTLEHKSKGRVLLVDDDPVILAQLGDALRKHHLNVVTVSSAIKALEVIRFGGIDFVISDINMPRMDGFEFRDNLRSSPKTASIPFVLLAATVTDSDSAVALELGVQEIILKPPEEQHLLDILRKGLGDGAFEPADPASAPNTGSATTAPSTGSATTAPVTGTHPAVPATPPPAPVAVAPPPDPAVAEAARQELRRVVEAAQQRFVALGLDTRAQGEMGVFGRLTLKQPLQDVSGQKIEKVGVYNVGPDKAKPFWPRALGTLPLIPLQEIADTAGLEKAIGERFKRRLDKVRGIKMFLDRLQIPNHYDPNTMRVLGQLKLGEDDVSFSVRDPKTLFLETIGGRSFGSAGGMKGRLVDITGTKTATDIEIQVDVVVRQLQALFEPSVIPAAEGSVPEVSLPEPSGEAAPSPGEVSPAGLVAPHEETAPPPLPPPGAVPVAAAVEAAPPPGEIILEAERPSSPPEPPAPAPPPPEAAAEAPVATVPLSAENLIAELPEPGGPNEDTVSDFFAALAPAAEAFAETALAAGPAAHAATVVGTPQLPPEQELDGGTVVSGHALLPMEEPEPEPEPAPEPAPPAAEPEPVFDTVVGVRQLLAEEPDPDPTLPDIPAASEPAPAPIDLAAETPPEASAAEEPVVDTAVEAYAGRPEDHLSDPTADTVLDTAPGLPGETPAPAAPPPEPPTDDEVVIPMVAEAPAEEPRAEIPAPPPAPAPPLTTAPASVAKRSRKKAPTSEAAEAVEAAPPPESQPEIPVPAIPPPSQPPPFDDSFLKDPVLLPVPPRVAAAPPPSRRNTTPAEPPPASADATVLICNECGKYYAIGSDVADERLLLICPDCIALQASP